MTADGFIVRVTYKTETVELHEFKNKKKAIAARDEFRKMETVASAKMFRADDPKRMSKGTEEIENTYSCSPLLPSCFGDGAGGMSRAAAGQCEGHGRKLPFL